MADSVGRRGFLGQFLKLIGVAAGAGAVAGVSKKTDVPKMLLGGSRVCKGGVLEPWDSHRAHVELHRALLDQPPLVDNMSGLVDGLSRESWVRSLDNVKDLERCPQCKKLNGHIVTYGDDIGRCDTCETAHMNAIGIPTGAPKWTVPPHSDFRVGFDSHVADIEHDEHLLAHVRATMISREERDAANDRLWKQRMDHKQRADEDRALNDAVAHEAMKREGEVEQKPLELYDDDDWSLVRAGVRAGAIGWGRREQAAVE